MSSYEDRTTEDDDDCTSSVASFSTSSSEKHNNASSSKFNHNAINQQDVTFVTAEGNKYVGQPWLEDVPVVGALFYSFGNRYEGELLNGSPHGYGQMVMIVSSSSFSVETNNNNNNNANSSTTNNTSNNISTINNSTNSASEGNTIIYDGEWRLGLRCGSGRLRRFKKGVSSQLLYQFEGNFLNDLQHGSGVETIYVGGSSSNTNNTNTRSNSNIKNNNINQNNNGRILTLSSVSSSSSGESKMETRFTGSFLKGLRHGHGILEDFLKAKIIEGEFSENLPSGRIQIRWNKDNTAEHLRSFDGYFVKGKMEGEGKLMMRNGDIFIGTFQQDKRKEGFITDADGKSHQRRVKYDDAGLLIEFEDVESGSIGVADKIQSITQKLQNDSISTDDHNPGKKPVTSANSNNNTNKNQSSRSLLSSTATENNNSINSRSVDNIHATIQFPNGDIFTGETLLGKASGKGVLTFAKNGGQYEGEFSDGLFHGKGKLVRNQQPDETVIISDSCGRCDGRSVVVTTSSLLGSLSPSSSTTTTTATVCWRYEGNFVNGLFHGSGKWWNFRGDSFEGNFLDGEMKIGKYVWNNDEKNNGSNDNSLMTMIKLVKYEGEFLSNEPHGSGSKWFENKVIRGRFEHGKCCSSSSDDQDDDNNNNTAGSIEYFARISSSSDNNNNNQNNNNNLHYYYSMDEVVENYTGGILNDQRSGFGEMIYQNGDSYYGEWENDLRHGVGILSSSSSNSSSGERNSVIYEGKFKNNNPDGPFHARNTESNTNFVGSAVSTTSKTSDDNNNKNSAVAASYSLTGIVSDASGFEKQIIAP